MNRTLLALALLGTIQICALAQTTQPPAFDLSISREDRLKGFDEACKAVDKYFFDPNFNGIDWRSIKTKYRPLAESAADKTQLQRVLQNMFNELHTSHMFVNMGFSFGTGLILFKLDQQSLVSYVDPGSPAREQYFWAVNTNSPRGSPLTLPWANYFTAKNDRLEGRGVTPDEPVNYTFKDFRENNDPDLDRARALPGR
jgi:Tricorn protease C1 domain